MRPPATVRVRLTALYGGLFLFVTTAMLVTIDVMLQRMLDQKMTVIMMGTSAPAGPRPARLPVPPPIDPHLSLDANMHRWQAALKPATGNARYVGSVHTAADLRHMVLQYQWTVTFVAVAVLTVVAVTAGWWLAGRVLRPLHRITATARRLSLSTLDERIALEGPRDELKELADTFDAMLERLERAVHSQRRFIANASHELRTPLAIQRAAIEIGLDGATPERLAEMRAELLAANLRTERLIDGLLVLAQGERGLDRREPVDLAEAAAEAVRQYLGMAETAGVGIRLDTRPVMVAGDPVLLARLLDNLVHNAVRYNRPGGEVLVQVTHEGLVEVTNTGPQVPADRMGELFEPFRRLHATRTGSEQGAGLGLSIVSAIAQAHHAEVAARPRPGGGLVVSVALQALAPALAG